MSTKKLLFWGFLIAFIAIDLAVKAWVRQALAPNQSLGLPWPGVFEIQLTFNQGIAFGQLQGKGVLMSPIALIIAGGAGYYVYKHPEESRWNHAAFGLLASGALGNMYDRLIAHRVTDMFWFRLINFPVFNVADSCITVATIMLILGWWKEAAARGKVEATAPSES